MEGFFIRDDNIGHPDPDTRQHSYEMTKASALWSMGMIKAGLAADEQGIKEGLRFVQERGFGLSCLLAMLSHIQNLVKVCQQNGIKTMYDDLDMSHVNDYVAQIEKVCEAAEQQFQKAEKATEN